MAYNLTLVPAYGRDYKSKNEVMADFDSNKDFEVATMFQSGRYTNKADLLKIGEKEVAIRYQKLTKIMVVKL